MSETENKEKISAGGLGPVTITAVELKKVIESFETASLNLSERYKKLEEEIKDLKENLNAVLESLPVGIIITDQSDSIRFINKSLAELVDGYPLISYLGKSIGEFGGFFFDSPSAAEFARPAFYPVEKIMKTAPDKFIHVFLYVKTMHGSNKKAAGRIFIVQNIEEIKKIKRLAEIGEMSAKIAHEIRNPLGSIGLFASILQKELKNDEHLEVASNIMSAVKNMNTTINNVLEFSRTVTPSFSDCRLSSVIEKSIIYSSHLISEKNISVEKEVDENIMLKIDENLISQVFVNILINSSQAVKDSGGRIRIKSGAVSMDENESAYVRVDFEDNGPGFAGNTEKDIFTPFFSTKKSGGTGLGLSIALNNVLAHGGYIRAENSGGLGGAKISVFLPYMA